MRSRGGLRALAKLIAVGVIEEAEAQREVLPAESSGQWLERVHGGDAAVSGAVERHVAGRAHDAHSTDRSILRDHEIDGHFASLAQRRTGDFRYQVVPIQANIVHQAREVSAEVNAHGVAEDFHVALNAAARIHERRTVVAAGTGVAGTFARSL